MANQILTPTVLVADGGGLDVTAAMAAPTQTTLQFVNTGREFLAISVTTASINVTVNVGTTVLGQAVAAFTPVALTVGHLYLFGQFHSAVNGAIAGSGNNNVTITLSSLTNVTCALLQSAGVY